MALFLAHIFGLFIHPFELDFNSNFSYPLDLKNFRDIIEMIKENKQSIIIMRKKAAVIANSTIAVPRSEWFSVARFIG